MNKVLRGMLFGIMALIVLSVLMVQIWRPLIIPREDVLDVLYGARLVSAENIPYSYTEITLGGEWSVVIPKYYSLPKVLPFSEVSGLFLQLIELPHDSAQLDPNKIWSEGGQCQSFSIYLKAALEVKGIRCGYLPSFQHVAVWAILDGVPYKLDVLTKEFAVVSQKDLDLIESEIGPIE